MTVAHSRSRRAPPRARSGAFVHRAGAGGLGQDRTADPALPAAARARGASRGNRRGHVHQESRGRDARTRAARRWPMRRRGRLPERITRRLTLELAAAALARDAEARLAHRRQSGAAAHPDHRLAVRGADAPDAGAVAIRLAAGEHRGRVRAVPRGGARDRRTGRERRRGRAGRRAAARASRQRRRAHRGRCSPTCWRAAITGCATCTAGNAPNCRRRCGTRGATRSSGVRALVPAAARARCWRSPDSLSAISEATRFPDSAEDWSCAGPRCS